MKAATIIALLVALSGCARFGMKHPPRAYELGVQPTCTPAAIPPYIDIGASLGWVSLGLYALLPDDSEPNYATDIDRHRSEENLVAAVTALAVLAGIHAASGIHGLAAVDRCRDHRARHVEWLNMMEEYEIRKRNQRRRKRIPARTPDQK